MSGVQWIETLQERQGKYNERTEKKREAEMKKSGERIRK